MQGHLATQKGLLRFSPLLAGLTGHTELKMKAGNELFSQSDFVSFTQHALHECIISLSCDSLRHIHLTMLCLIYHALQSIGVAKRL